MKQQQQKQTGASGRRRLVTLYDITIYYISAGFVAYNEKDELIGWMEMRQGYVDNKPVPMAINLYVDPIYRCGKLLWFQA